MFLKRYFAILLSIVLMLSLLPAGVFAEEGDPCAEGHDYVPAVTEPTCTEDGYITYTCSRCEDSYTEPGEAALGHEIGQDDRNDHQRCKQDDHLDECLFGDVDELLLAFVHIISPLHSVSWMNGAQQEDLQELHDLFRLCPLPWKIRSHCFLFHKS